MALISCPECASKVSGQATACPQCGHPLETTSPPRAQAVAETGVATANAKTCPRCRKAVDPLAYKCPYCKKTLRTSPAAWGCLVLIVLFIVVMIIVANQQPSNVAKSPTLKPAPETQQGPAQSSVRIVCALQQHIHSNPRDLYAALESALGSDAMYDRVQQERQWIGGARFTGGRMEIYEEDGGIDQINIWFDPPLRRNDALTMFGFPTNTPPTDEGPLFFVWKKVFGIDKLHFSRVRGSNKIESAIVER